VVSFKRQLPLGYSFRLDGIFGASVGSSPDLIIFVRVIVVAVAVGLDVLAISVGVGIARLAYDASLRVGLSFASS